MEQPFNGTTSRTLMTGQWDLHSAAFVGDASKVKALLAQGYDPNAFSEWGKDTPLHAAAKMGHGDIVQLLLEAGANLHAFDDLADTPLHCAVDNGHLDIMQLLLQAGADVNAHNESQIGDSPLGQTAGTCSLAVAQALLAAGADPTIQGWMQNCALDRAKERTDEEGQKVYELLCHAARLFHVAP